MDSIVLISRYRSRFPKFSTCETVSNFVIKDLGDRPDGKLAEVLDRLIEESWQHSKREYRRDPSFYQVLMNSEVLDTPIIVTIREPQRNSEADVEQILNEVDKLAQSEKFYLFLESRISLTVTVH